MKNLILASFIAAAAFAQDPPQQTAPAKPSTQDTAAPAAEGTGEQTGVEPNLSASVEVGYRWNGKLHGNLDAYRSVVNLGEGPRLLGFDFNFTNPTQGKWLDRFTMRASGWGGDPYAHLRGELLANGKYRLTFDHRTMAYFNALPSFANPNVQRGILFSQSQWDIFHRVTDLELELRPGKRVIPYFGFMRSNNSGRGVSTYVSNANEFPVANSVSDNTNNYRGGVRLEFSRAHVTLEQGGTTFNDDQRLFTADRNTGNRTTPFLGQTLLLNNLSQVYGISGDSIYTRVLATARPADWIDLYGNFLFAQPKTTGNLNINAAGLFVLPGNAGTALAETALLNATAKQPHTNVNGGFEIRPFRRLRIIEGYLTDRFHTASTLFTPGTLDRLNVNFSQNQIEALVDVTSRLTLRGGHKIVWGDSLLRAPSLVSELRTFERGERRVNSALFGGTYRVSSKVSAYADVEIARGSGRNAAYYATSLRDYERLRFRFSYQPVNTLTFTGNYAYFRNTNPYAQWTFDFDSRTASAAVLWTPKNSKRYRVLGEYARTTFWSDTLYIVPNTLQRDRSFYDERGHSGSGLFDVGFGSRGPRFSFGGSFWRSTGSRPTRFYQPMARVSMPIVAHMEWNAEWRWFGLNEPFYLFENFRQHQAIFSIRFF